MGRSRQTGLRYLSLDVDFFDDDKICLIEEKFGINGVYVLIRLLCVVFKEGYFYRWGDDECRLFVRKLGIAKINKEFVRSLVKEAVRREFFDRRMFETYSILTSHGIQKRYIEATSRFTSVVFRKEYLLVELPVRSNVFVESENDRLENKHPMQCGVREQIGELFTFKNFPKPMEEVEMFMKYYGGRGWIDSNGNTITDKVAIAEFWEPSAWRNKKKEREYSCPAKLLKEWEKVYGMIKSEIGDKVYGTFLQIRPVRYRDGVLLFEVPGKDLYEVIEKDYLDVFKRSLQIVYGDNVRVEYTLLKSE